MTKFFNSGLYEKAFYREHELDCEAANYYDDISYDEELLTEHYKKDLELEYSDDDYLSDKVNEIFWEKLSCYNTCYEPLVFNAEIALECKLLPFSYKGIDMLALSGCGMDLSPKLDAYQTLSHGSIDRNSKFFSVPNQEYFEYAVGKGIMDKMQEILINESIHHA